MLKSGIFLRDQAAERKETKHVFRKHNEYVFQKMQAKEKKILLTENVDIQDCQRKLSYLIDNFDDKTLKKVLFSNHFKCKSLIQTYDIFDNDQYKAVGEALQNANILIKDPFLFKDEYERN